MKNIQHRKQSTRNNHFVMRVNIFKSLFLIALILLALFFSFKKTSAIESKDNGYKEKITDFQSSLSLNEDGTSVIVEKIFYDFGANYKHGIYRNLPTKYHGRKGSPYLGLNVISVTDENDADYNFTTSRSGNGISIKIGDEGSLVTKQKVYVIKYMYSKSINSMDDRDELSWNAFGDGWTVPVDKATASIELPAGFDKKILGVNCYSGYYGSKGKCTQSNENELLFSQNAIQPGNSMTVVTDFQKNTFPPPSALEIFFWEKPWYYALPFISFGILFAIWFKKGRDAKGKGNVIVEFDAPKGITPLEAGTIIDNKVDKKDISAEIIYIATKGFIKIRRIENKRSLTNIFQKDDFELIKLKGKEQEENTIDRLLLDGIFGKGNKVKLSKPRKDLFITFKKIKRNTYENLVKKGYFRGSPRRVKVVYWVLGGLLTYGGFVFGAQITKTDSAILFVMTPGVLMLLFSFVMPARTKLGAETREYLLGLKEYIGVAEKDRIAFHNTPEKSPDHFEKLLPFAMIFGLEKKWANKFKDIYKVQPDWYEGNMTNFNTVVFTSSINDFSSAASNSFGYSGSGSVSRGGFSGGGFGGGGGGSW